MLRVLRCYGKVSLILALILATHLIGPLPQLGPRWAHAANEPAPPMPQPEDPLGQSVAKETSDISIQVDARDGHLVVRVVDLWGPGRVPLVVRSYTNADLVSSEDNTTHAYRWQWNHLLDIRGVGVLEPDGNRDGTYRYSHDRQVGSPPNYELWQVYVKDVGQYRTLEQHYNCTTVRDPNPPETQRLPQVLRPLIQPSPTPRPTPRPGGALARQQVRVQGTVQAAPDGCVASGRYVVYLPKGVVRSYQSNLITEERDANGNATTFVYRTDLPENGSPHLHKVRDPIGRELTYDWEAAYRYCAEVAEPGGGAYCSWWVTVYRVRRVTDSYGSSVTYTYAGNHSLWGFLVTEARHSIGRVTRYGYTPRGLLASVINARGHGTAVEWSGGSTCSTLSGSDTTPRVTKVTAPDGAATSYGYTIEALTVGTWQACRVTRSVMTDARGHGTTYEMYRGSDEKYVGNVERVTDPLGNLTQLAYDARRNTTQVTDARGLVTTYEYSGRNMVTRVIRDPGRLNLTTTLSWDGNDNLLSVTNPRGIRTDYAYDSRHNLTAVRKAVGTADESLTQYQYNTWGGVTAVTDPRGFTTQYTYTARRQIAQIIPPAGGTVGFEYDTLDNQTGKIDGNGRRWTTAYDVHRLVTSVTDPLGNVIRYEYDLNGNRTAVVDAKGQRTSFTYDSRDRITMIADPLAQQTQYGYDAVGNLTRITNARGHATTFGYDAANRLNQVTDALGQTTTYGYDQVGNRNTMQDRRGQRFSYRYDEANRLRHVDSGIPPTSGVWSSGQSLVSYAYDPNGNRTAMQDGTGTTQYGYDNLDRLVSIQYPDGRVVRYTYDRAGNRTSLVNPGNVTTTYGYDAANRLQQVAQGGLTWSFTYDGAGNRMGLTAPNGTSTQYTYLANNWLASITDRAPGGAVITSVAYTYDANGNRTTQSDPSGQTTYGYDALNRLTGAAYPGTYGTWGWTYDQVGNRTSQTSPSGTTSYTYDANNRLTVAGSKTYTYDANGNVTGVSTGEAFSYDPFNRLTYARNPSGQEAHYAYNGDGLKIRRQGPDGVTRYYYDGIKPIWETDDAGNLKSQLDRDIFGNLLSRRESSGARRYYHYDGLGSMTALTNESGTTTATMLYDAWGNVRANSGSAHGNYRFTGAELDATTGLYHMHARFYDPTIGRWLSEDPVQHKHFEPATLNFYTYVQSNPTGLVDPDGEFPRSPLNELGLGLLVHIFARFALTAQRLQDMSTTALSATGTALTQTAIRVALSTNLVGTYDSVRQIARGYGNLVHVHHIIPARFAELFGMSKGKLPGIALPGNVHKALETIIQRHLKRDGDYTLQQVIARLKDIYGKHAPDILKWLQEHPDWSKYFK
jgi:RHS repeat-associated protein